MRSARIDGQSPGSSGNGTEAEFPDPESGVGAAHAARVNANTQGAHTRRVDALEDVGRGGFMDSEPGMVRDMHWGGPIMRPRFTRGALRISDR
jgi:hypothetical protein